jgi:hypothetical protein
VIVLEGTEEQIKSYRMKLYNMEVSSAVFHDDDLDNMLTAVAFEPIDRNLGKVFSNLKLA